MRNAVKEVFMPALSSTMTEGKIVSWLKTEGDAVEKGEPIVVVESDKADMDVESFNSGFLGAIVVPEGGVATVGAPIAFIAEEEAEVAVAKEKAGENGAPSAEASAPPPPPPAPAPAQAAETPPPATKPTENSAPEAQAPAPAPAVPVVKRADGRIIATPYAKKLAKQLKVDLATVAATGPAGRITASDVEAASRGVRAPPPAAPAPARDAGPPPAPAPATAAPSTTVAELRGTTEPFNTLQKSVAQNMINSLQVPEFRVAMTIDTDKLDSLYKKLKPHGVTMTTLLGRACGLALADHPLLFASCTPDGAGITYNEHVNVAVAVAMPDGGLITPVLKDCDTRDVYTLSNDWADLVKRSRAKKLAPDEYSTGTFTMSNLGMYGVDTFDAILPVGTTAILAIAGSKPCVVANADGLIGVRKQMTVNLTCDHRVVYGAHAAEFLQTLKSIIESPEQLTL